MRRNPIEKNSRGVWAVMDVIRKNPGLESFQIAAMCAYSMPHTKNVLSVISSQAMALPVPKGTKRVWYEAAIAAPMLETWNKTRRKRRKPGDPKPVTHRQKIEELAARPEGASAAVIMKELGITLNALGKHCGSLVRQGRLFRAEREGCRLRWFRTEADAAAWCALGPPPKSEWAVPRQKINDQPTIRTRIVKLAEQKHGVTKDFIELQMPAMQRKNITRHISVLVGRGDLYPSKRPGCYTRWCASEADAKEWASLPPTNHRQQEEKARKQRIEQRKAEAHAKRQAERARKAEEKAKKAMKKASEKGQFFRIDKRAIPAPVVIKKQVVSSEVDYSRAKVTICPSAASYDSRYQVAPGARITGEFSREWQQRRGAA